ncbi:MAG: ABC-three component system middle component 8 [Pseudomonas protegens]
MLLLPNKNAHPDLTILSVSAFLLTVLKKHKVQAYSDLYSKLAIHEERASYLFEGALDLLFLLGLIQYHPKNDIVEYVGI